MKGTHNDERLSIIFDYIPTVYPQYYSKYPDSSNKIFNLIAVTIIMSDRSEKNLQNAPAQYRKGNQYVNGLSFVSLE
jgi:hypothetical protein